MATDGVVMHLDALLALSRELQESLSESAEQIEECNGPNSIMKELDGCFKRVTRTNAHFEKFKERYVVSIEEVRGGASEERILELESLLSDIVKTIPGIRWSKNSKYLEFKERLWQVNHPDDNCPPISNNDSDDNDDDEVLSEGEQDIIVSSIKSNLTCPLTQTLFKDPVTNPTCGHSYSRDAILALSRSGTSVPCPLNGCNRSVIISRLEPNKVLERRIKQRNQPRIFV